MIFEARRLIAKNERLSAKLDQELAVAKIDLSASRKPIDGILEKIECKPDGNFRNESWKGEELSGLFFQNVECGNAPEAALTSPSTSGTAYIGENIAYQCADESLTAVPRLESALTPTIVRSTRAIQSASAGIDSRTTNASASGAPKRCSARRMGRKSA